MSNRIYGIDKVDNIIGLRDQHVYDSIDVYIDNKDQNNVWGMVYSTDYVNHKPIRKQEIVRFTDYQSMINYVRSNFNGYELDHPVDINHKQIFFHKIDYCDIRYYLHEGKPNLNYIVVRFLEYENGAFANKRIKLSPEYEEMFKSILKTSKKIPDNMSLSSQYYSDVDVYEERANNRKEVIRSITVPIGEFFSIAGDRIRNIRFNKKKVFKNVKIVISTAALATILIGGYTVVTDNLYNSDYLVQKNTIRSIKDLKMFFSQGRVGKDLEKLIANNYDDISPDELKFVIDFINNIENNNYDNNESFNSFSYSEYFKYEVGGDEKFTLSSDILTKIERLYNDCFYIDDGKVIIIKQNVHKYIDYVLSLTLMHDAYYSSKGGSLVNIDTHNPLSKYANEDEIAVFEDYPPILKYIIMNQLRGLLKRCDYQVDQKPTYYFKSTDKYDLLTELNSKMNEVLDELYFNCGYNYRGKSM